MRAVVDTNVFVSAMLSPAGIPARILTLILNRHIILLISSGIFEEYEEVLKRKEFSFNEETIHTLLRMMTLYAEKVTPISHSISLPDPDDLCFLECAITAKADFLITGNKRHFPAALCHPIKVVSPSEFVTAGRFL